MSNNLFNDLKQTKSRRHLFKQNGIQESSMEAAAKEAQLIEMQNHHYYQLKSGFKSNHFKNKQSAKIEQEESSKSRS